MTYLDQLQAVADADVASLRKAQLSYGDSWKRRGGVGAFMMLARKWDRLENAMTKPMTECVVDPECDGREGHRHDGPCTINQPVDSYDIFIRTEIDERAEGLIDDIRDLRRYLMLVEAELRARGNLHEEVKK